MKELEKFEEDILKILEREHVKRNGNKIDECGFECFFKRFKKFIMENAQDDD